MPMYAARALPFSRNFALLGALTRWPGLQRRINHYLTVGTADEIRGLLDLPESVQIALDDNLLCVLRRERARLFILRPREIEELKAIVREGRQPDVEAEAVAADPIVAEACEMTSAAR